MGEAERKGLSYLADAANADALNEAYKDARASILHQARVEKTVVKSSSVLFGNPAEAEKKLVGFDSLIDQRAAVLLNEAKTVFAMSAEMKKAPSAEPAPTDAEKVAARTIVERSGGDGGFGGFGGGGRQAQMAAMEKMTPAERAEMMAARNKVPAHMTSELNILLGKKMTVLEIRDFLTGEFEPLPLADLMAYLKFQEKSGALKLTEKPEEPKPASAPAPKPAKAKSKK
jgi:hypothetical protein